MTSPLYRLGRHQPGAGMVPHEFDDVYELRGDRYVAAPSANQVDLILRIFREVSGPFRVVYDLLVPFGDQAEGRYELSEPLDYVALKVFLDRFRDFFERDARHHVLVSTLTDTLSVIYDQHNVIYAQGPEKLLQNALHEHGLKRGKIEMPNPHTHHYHEVLDPIGDELFAYGNWVLIGETEMPLENTQPVVAVDEIGER